MSELPAEEIRVIEFGVEDAQEISDLLRHVWPLAHDYPEDWRTRRMYTVEQVIEEMRSGFHYFGSRLGGNIVGLYKASITELGLYGEQQTVIPACRTSGLASAMYIQFDEYGRANGCIRVYCNILVGQDAGVRLMKKFGFRLWGDPYEQHPGMLVQMYEKPL